MWGSVRPGVLIEAWWRGAGQRAEGMEAGERALAAGMVFQFPERHFLGSTIQEELVFGWPSRPDDGMARLGLTMRARAVCSPGPSTRTSLTPCFPRA